MCVCAQSLIHVQLCVTPKDGGPPGRSVHGILQARILEWVVMPSPLGHLFDPGIELASHVSFIGRWVLYHQCHLADLSNYKQNFLQTPRIFTEMK